MAIEYAFTTYSGSRDYNEDYGLAMQTEKGDCYMVADGLGGHGKGELASASVCESAARLFRSGEAAVCVEELFEIAQKELLARQMREHAVDAMKTTMNIVLIVDGIAYWGHVGDTRTYYFKKNKLVRRTKDHSVPQMLVAMGEIKERNIRHHPDRNRLLKVMGIEWDKPQYVIETAVKLEKKQAFLMCTDGFWEYIEDKDMEKCLKKAKSPQEWLDAMNEIVRENGAGADLDNYTAMAVWIQ